MASNYPLLDETENQRSLLDPISGENAVNPKASIELDMDLNNKTHHEERFQHFLDNGIESDIVLLAGKDKEVVQAHKLILMIGSPILRHKIHLMKEEEESKLAFPDVEPDDLKLFLKFLYTGIHPKTVEDAMSLLAPAETYLIPDLTFSCQELIKSHLTNENALGVHEKASEYGNQHLKQAAMDHICRNAAQIIEQKDFEKISMKTLIQILEKDDLTVIDEIQLFDAVMRWANAECERQKVVLNSKYLRSILEEAIHLIRFPIMNSYDFALKVATAQVLLTEEVVSILTYFLVPESARHTFRPGVFNSKPRKAFTPVGKIFTLKRQSDFARDSFQTKITTPITYSLKFQVEDQIWIRCIKLSPVLFQRDGNHPAFQATVKIIKAECCITQQTVAFKSSGNLKIEFEKPVRIRKNELYSISVSITGDFGGFQQNTSSELVDENDVEYDDYDDKDYDGSDEEDYDGNDEEEEEDDDEEEEEDDDEEEEEDDDDDEEDDDDDEEEDDDDEEDDDESNWFEFIRSITDEDESKPVVLKMEFETPNPVNFLAEVSYQTK